MNLDERWGLFSLRVWMLILNFVSNAVGLYGFAGYLRNGSGLGILALGVGLTVICLIVLSKPQED